MLKEQEEKLISGENDAALVSRGTLDINQSSYDNGQKSYTKNLIKNGDYKNLKVNFFYFRKLMVLMNRAVKKLF